MNMNFNPSSPTFHFILAITTTHWRMPHFYLVHRMIHPWRLSGSIPDIGKFLYRHVHSLHHKVHLNCETFITIPHFDS